MYRLLSCHVFHQATWNRPSCLGGNSRKVEFEPSCWREIFEKLNSNPRLGGLHAGSHVEGGGVCSLLLSLSVLVMRQQAATRQWICFMVHRVCNKFKEMGMIMVVIGG